MFLQNLVSVLSRLQTENLRKQFCKKEANREAHHHLHSRHRVLVLLPQVLRLQEVVRKVRILEGGKKMAMTERWARAMVAQHAKELREAVNAVLAYETDAIIHHKLAEVCAECAWCEREYGEAER